MKKVLVMICVLWVQYAPCLLSQNSEVLDERIKTLMVRVNDDWRRAPVIELNGGDYIDVRFDDLNAGYTRYTYEVQPLTAAWEEAQLSTSEFLEGFNGQYISDYVNSRNTIVQYTHYHLRLPNRDMRITKAGNYEIVIKDESSKPVAKARFAISSRRANPVVTVSSDTDIDYRRGHHQLRITVPTAGLPITNASTELTVVIQQNQRTDNMQLISKPTIVAGQMVEYSHEPQLIFKAGNEYRRFEMTSYRVPGMGVHNIEAIDDYYHATLYPASPRPNYIYDEDQNGAFILRCENTSNPNSEGEYLLVHFTATATGYVTGNFTNHQQTPDYELTYNSELGLHHASVFMKQGYYNYLILSSDPNFEGSYYETRNDYQVYVYHRPFGARIDELVGFSTVSN